MAIKRTRPTEKPPKNLIDRFVDFCDPVRGEQRQVARVRIEALESFKAGRSGRKPQRNWNPNSRDADSDILGDLPTLRARSRDLERNDPIASSAIHTVATNTAGTGMKLKCEIDHEALGMTEEQADEWEAATEREFHNWAKDVRVAADKQSTFYEMQFLSMYQECLNGDAFVMMPRFLRALETYSLHLQMVENDRITNADNASDTDTLAGGILTDKKGEPQEYHVMLHHPGRIYSAGTRKWRKVKAVGAKSHLPNMVHYFTQRRPGQRRGKPLLSAVMEPLKQLQRYTDAELDAAVVSAFFTVFIKSEDPAGLLSEIQDLNSDLNVDSTDYTMGTGNVLGLAPGESVEVADPGRPNTAFEPFLQAILKTVAVGVNLPVELLMQQFTTSFTAARAALLQAAKHFRARRCHLAAHFCQPVYEVWLSDAVAMGRIAAPGFFADPVLRRAWLGSTWIGDAFGTIREVDAMKAADMRLEMGISSKSFESLAATGRPIEQVQRERRKEEAAEPTPEKPESNEDETDA